MVWRTFCGVCCKARRGRWYALDHGQESNEKLQRWNQEAFELLSQLYQMTVTDVARVPTLPITISK